MLDQNGLDETNKGQNDSGEGLYDFLVNGKKQGEERIAQLKKLNILDNKTITILITDSFFLTNGSDGASANCLNTYVISGTYEKSLNEHEHLVNKEVDNVQIIICIAGGMKQISIIDSEKERLKKYIIEGPHTDNNNFDCQSFIHFMKGVRMRDHETNGRILQDKRDFNKIDTEGSENFLSAGQCICILKKDKGDDVSQIHHFAYYLGNGYFLSKHGDRLGLYVNTLSQLQEFYGTEETYIIFPNSAHPDVSGDRISSFVLDVKILLNKNLKLL